LPEEQGANARQFDRAPFEYVAANYLETIGTPLLQGRGFTKEEERAKAPVVIVSEAMARNLWPNDTPLGKTFRVERPLRNGSQIVFPAAQVIGVARDNQLYRVGQTPPLFFYAPQSPTEWMDTSLNIRTARDAASMKELVRKEIYALEPVLRLWVDTMEERIAKDKSIGETRAASELAACLGGLALLLAAIGIYGVMAWSVAQRTREIGIRMALGAQRRDVLTLVLHQGMGLVLLGVTIGVAASLAVTQVMKSLLFRSERDRSGNVYRSHVSVSCCGARGLLASGPAGGESRPDDCASIRMITAQRKVPPSQRISNDQVLAGPHHPLVAALLCCVEIEMKH